MRICSVLFIFIFFHNLLASESDLNNKNNAIVGLNINEKFSIYQPTYFIFGLNDLKLQFSFKYRLAKSLPMYFGFTQKMFWSIYSDSKPFKDINYIPEFYYRFLDEKDNTFKTLDMGYMHTSNGKKGVDSRSFDRVFLRSNYITRVDRHNIDSELIFYNIYSYENSNPDIVKHMGYWELKINMTDIVTFEKKSLDIEVRLFAGDKILNLNKGAYQFGLIYNFASTNMNPSIYLQRYEGYVENLLEYSQRHTEYRIGFLLSY